MEADGRQFCNSAGRQKGWGAGGSEGQRLGGGTRGRSDGATARAIVAGKVSHTVGSGVAGGVVSYRQMGMVAAVIVNVDVKARVSRRAAKIDVGMVVLPLHVVVVQQRPHYGQKKRIQGNYNRRFKQLRHRYEESTRPFSQFDCAHPYKVPARHLPDAGAYRPLSGHKSRRSRPQVLPR